VCDCCLTPTQESFSYIMASTHCACKTIVLSVLRRDTISDYSLLHFKNFLNLGYFNAYCFTDKVVYEGCFVDSDTRLFPYMIGVFNFTTNDFCILACTDKGYAFAGTEVLLIIVYTFFMKPNMLYFYG